MLAVARGQAPPHPRVDALRMRGGHLAQHLPHRVQADPPMSGHSCIPSTHTVLSWHTPSRGQ